MIFDHEHGCCCFSPEETCKWNNDHNLSIDVPQYDEPEYHVLPNETNYWYSFQDSKQRIWWNGSDTVVLNHRNNDQL